MASFASAATAAPLLYGATSTQTIRTTISSPKAGSTVVLDIPSRKTPQPTSYTTVPFAVPSQGIYPSPLPILVVTALEAVLIAGHDTLWTVTALQTAPPSITGSAAASEVTVVMAPNGDNWSIAEKAGVAVAAILLTLLFIACMTWVCLVRSQGSRGRSSRGRDVEARRGRSRRARKVPQFRLISAESELAGKGRLVSTRWSLDTEAPLVGGTDDAHPPPLPPAPAHLGARVPLGGRHDEGRRSIEREAERIISDRRARLRNDHYRRRSDTTEVNFGNELRPSHYRQNKPEPPPPVAKAHPSLRPPQTGTVAPQNSVRMPILASTTGNRPSEDSNRTTRGVLAGPSRTWYNLGGIRSVSKMSKMSRRSEDNESAWEDATTESSVRIIKT
jgi:hypothetical protein